MSGGNDIFDLLSGPPSPAVQQPLQDLHVNMALPPPSSSNNTFSPNYNIDLSSLGSLQSTQTTSFGQMGQLNESLPFSPTSQQNGSPFDQIPQQTSSFPTQQTTLTFGQNTQPSASAFGQMPGGQNTQPSASAFGQMPGGQNTQPSASAFGQMPGGQNIQPSASAFGQMSGGQNLQPSASAFGQMPGGQNTLLSPSNFGQLPSGQSASAFGQMSGVQNIQPAIFGQMPGRPNTQQQPAPQQSSSLFGQGNQQPDPFGQSMPSPALFGQNIQPSFGQSSQHASQFGQNAQLTSPFEHNAPVTSQIGQNAQLSPSFGQTSTGQGTPQSMNQFGAIPNQSGNVTQAGVSNFQIGNTMPNIQNPSAQQTDPFAIFSNSSGSGTNTNSTNTNTNPSNEDFFGAFSSPSTSIISSPTASMPKSSSPSAPGDSFFDAFSNKSTTVANPPAPVSSYNSTAAEQSNFDPFGLMSSEKPRQLQASPQQQQQQQAPVEPLFDAFSSESVAAQSVPDTPQSPNVENNEDDSVEVKAEEPSTPSGGDQIDAVDSTVKPEITDPVLREISNTFGGRWRLIRSDPYDEFLKSVGVGMVHRKLAGKGTPEQSLDVKPDGHIHVTIRSALHSQAYVFKLNEEKENLVEKTSQSVFCSYSNGKLFLQMTPSDDSFGKTQEVERYINENHEMVQIHSAGVASCRRYFLKLDGNIKRPTSLQVSDSKSEETSLAAGTPSPTVQSPLPVQLVLQTKEAPKSPNIHQRSSPVVESPPISKPLKSPVAVVDLSQSVAALGMQSSSRPTSTSTSPTPAISPGQLLLQNLQSDSASGEGGEANAFDIRMPDAGNETNEEKLIFAMNGGITEESEA